MGTVDVAADAHVVGTPPVPPGQLSDWIMREVHFHGFAGLTTTRDEDVLSPEFSCFGHQWAVAIYPGGHEGEDESYVAVYLHNRSSESIVADYKIVTKHPTNQTQRSFEADSGDEIDEIVTFGGKGSGENSWGERNFATRGTLLTYLDNGTLTLEVHLRKNKQAEPASRLE